MKQNVDMQGTDPFTGITKFHGGNVAAGGGFFVKGTVLGQSFYKKIDPVYAGDGHSQDNVWVASGAGSIAATESFQVCPGNGKELYYGTVSVAIPPDLPGAGFTARMNGTCACVAQQCAAK
jgi:hypothetical protein